MRIHLFILLFLITDFAIGQKINYSLEFGPNISFLADNQFTLGYAVPISPAIGQSYRIQDNIYSRSGDVAYGANLGFKIDYGFSKRFYLISGLTFDYLNSKITTSMSSSNFYFSVSNQHPQLTLGENIDGYIPNDLNGNTLWRLLIDENGIPVSSGETDYSKYKIEEQIGTIYLSIPVKVGFSLHKNIQLSLGLVNSFLLYSKINTTYPYTDDRILKNNISKVNKYMFSIQSGLAFKVSKKLGILVNYQRSISDMIELNSRYDVKDGNKLNNFNIGLNILISNIKEE